MAKREILAGATDQTIDIFVPDSSSTTGAGLTGLVHNTASLTCYYRKGATGTPTSLSLATQTVGGAHSDGGFVAVDGTNCPGQYRLDLSDTIVATAGMVTLYLKGATNMAPVLVEIEVVSVNKFDSVRMGMTALPNAAAEAAGGLYTRGSGAGQINQAANGQVDVNAVAISGDSTAADNAESFFDGTGYAGTGNVIPTVTMLTNLPAIPWNAAWDAEVQSEVQDALEANNLDHLVKIAVDTDFATTVHLNSVIGQLADNGSSATFDRTTDSLEAVRDRGDAAWVTATGFSTHTASDVWAVATRTLTAGTNIVLTKGTGVTGFNDLSAAQINAECDTALADVGLTTTVTGRIDATVSTRLASASYTAPLDASGTRTALGMTAADLDTQLDAILAASGGGSALTAADVWAYATRTLTSAASITSTGGTTVPQSGDAYALGVQILAAVATSGGAGATAASSPPAAPAAGGTIRIKRGDDYQSADGRAIPLGTVTTGLTLTSATLTVCRGPDPASAVLLSLACTLTAVSGGYSLAREMTAAQTSLLVVAAAGDGRESRHAWRVRAETSGGRSFTALEGEFLAH